MSNAIKFSPADSTIHITLAEAGNGVRVSVIDEGPEYLLKTGPGYSESFSD